jgi:uncharacterized protein YegP (UPF0339 family)
LAVVNDLTCLVSLPAPEGTMGLVKNEDQGVIFMADTGRKWEIYQDKGGKWRWRCFASNGKLVGSSSQGYKTKEDCAANAKSFGMA